MLRTFVFSALVALLVACSSSSTDDSASGVLDTNGYRTAEVESDGVDRQPDACDDAAQHPASADASNLTDTANQNDGFSGADARDSAEVALGEADAIEESDPTQETDSVFRSPPDPTTCPAPFVELVSSCASSVLAEADLAPQILDLVHAVEWCSDAEPVAAVWDAWCVSRPSDPWCATTFQAFYENLWPACANALRHAAFDNSCTFGPYWRTVAAQRGLFVTERMYIDSIAALDSSFESQQLLEAVRASAHSDVVEPAEALARVDADSMVRVTLWDVSNSRAWRAFEYAVGDNVYGRIFPLDSTVPVATIVDGDISGCVAMYGDTGRRCSLLEPCRETYSCAGIVDEIRQGACMPSTADRDSGALCSPTEPGACGGSASGEYCAAASGSDAGMCQSLQQRARFDSLPMLELNAGAAADVVVYASGLATVATDVWITLDIELSDRENTALLLRNPDGTQIDLRPLYSGRDLREPIQVVGFPGDELANGAWTLTLDTSASDVPSSSTLWQWTLVIGSRLD